MDIEMKLADLEQRLDMVIAEMAIQKADAAAGAAAGGAQAGGPQPAGAAVNVAGNAPFDVEYYEVAGARYWRVYCPEGSLYVDGEEMDTFEPEREDDGYLYLAAGEMGDENNFTLYLHVLEGEEGRWVQVDTSEDLEDSLADYKIAEVTDGEVQQIWRGAKMLRIDDGGLKHAYDIDWSTGNLVRRYMNIGGVTASDINGKTVDIRDHYGFCALEVRLTEPDEEGDGNIKFYGSLAALVEAQKNPNKFIKALYHLGQPREEGVELKRSDVIDLRDAPTSIIIETLLDGGSI